MTTADPSQVKETQERILEQASLLGGDEEISWPPSEKRPQEPEVEINQTKMVRIKNSLQAELQAIPFSQHSFDGITEVIVTMAQLARREGVLALEGLADYIDESLFKEGLVLIIDRTDPALVEDMMTTRKQRLMQHRETRYRMIIKGMLALQAGTNPLILSHKLQTFLTPTLMPRRGSYGWASVSELKEELQRRPFSQMDLDEIELVITSMAEVARKEGRQNWDELAGAIDEELLKTALYLALDDTNPGLLRDMLDARMVALLQYYETRYNMIIEGITSIQLGNTPRQIEAKMRSLYLGIEDEGVAGEKGGPPRESWQSLGIKEGLPSAFVHRIFQDREGNLWFGTDKGVCRYNGNEFRIFTTEDGLAGNNVCSILEDREGNLWFGSRSGGMSRYDGKQFKTFTAENGLTDNEVLSMLQDRKGNLWFGTSRGVSRYDGKRFAPFAPGEGLEDSRVTSILEDREGHLWFGTWGRGVRRYDGDRVTTFTTADGLASDWVTSILEDREGHLWFATGGGVSRYDGKQFVILRPQDGLASLWVNTIMEDQKGHLWFGTWTEGISRYDGLVFQNLLRRDGLVHNSVRHVLQDRSGDVWIATEGGISRYRPHPISPAIQLKDVVADRRYGPVARIHLPTTQYSLAFEFQGMSSKTRPEQIAYAYRLEGYDQEWRQTREGQVEYTALPRGDYVFQVKAVDRDLDYSETPAEVRVIVHLPYGQMALIGSLGLTLVGLVIASGYGIKRRQERNQVRETLVKEQQQRLEVQQQLMQELEQELQKAHDLQMGLMPREAPQVEGFEFAGRCFTANHVGGDFFKYYRLPHQHFLGVLADVTGHAMEAAVPLLMFSGILESQVELGGSIEELFGRLNRSLHRTLPPHTFVCLAMGELDPSTCTLRLANGGCPYPYHYRAATGEVVELQVDAYPLGVRPDTAYRGIEVQLAPGDRVVFCSDGIIEATNASGEMFGFERTGAAVRKGGAEGLSAGALLERLIAEVKTFSGEVPQGDDRTVVVLKVEK